MSVYLNFNNSLTDLVNFNRVAAPNYDLSFNKEFQSTEAITSHLQNYNAIKTSLTNYASYIKDAKDTHNILSDAQTGLSNILNNLQTMREIAVFGKNTTLTDDMRTEYGAMMFNLVKDIRSEANSYSYQNQKLLNGDFQQTDFTVGPNASDVISLNLSSVTPYALDLGDVSIEDFNSSMLSVESIDSAIAQVTTTMNSVTSYQKDLQNVLDRNHFSFVKMSDQQIESLSLQIQSSPNSNRSVKTLNANSITTFLYSQNNFAESTFSIKL